MFEQIFSNEGVVFQGGGHTFVFPCRSGSVSASEYIGAPHIKLITYAHDEILNAASLVVGIRKPSERYDSCSKYCQKTNKNNDAGFFSFYFSRYCTPYMEDLLDKNIQIILTDDMTAFFGEDYESVQGEVLTPASRNKHKDFSPPGLTKQDGDYNTLVATKPKFSVTEFKTIFPNRYVI